MNNDNKDKRLIGVDVKRFQYEEYANNLSDKKINIKEIIEDNLFKRKIDMNCIMIAFHVYDSLVGSVAELDFF